MLLVGVLVGALVVSTLVVWVLGGWERRTPEGPRAVAPGEEVEATPFRIRLDRAEATYEVGGDLADEGRAFVVAEGSLELEGPGSVGASILGEAIQADLESTYTLSDGVEEQGAPTTVYVAGDGTQLLGLGPGLSYDVLVVWTIDEAAVPSSMTVRLLEHTWRAGFLDEFESWFDPLPVAAVPLEVAPLPDDRPVEDGL